MGFGVWLHVVCTLSVWEEKGFLRVNSCGSKKTFECIWVVAMQPLCSAHKVASLCLNTWSLQMPRRPSANAAWQTCTQHGAEEVSLASPAWCRRSELGKSSMVQKK